MPQNIFWLALFKTSFKFLLFKKTLKTLKIKLIWNKVVKVFHKYCPAANWVAVSAKFVFEPNLGNSNFWKISSVITSNIPVALNISFSSDKGLKINKICRNLNLQEPWPSWRSGLFFSDKPTLMLETNFAIGNFFLS